MMSQASRILAGLVAGLVLGALAASLRWQVDPLVSVAGVVGGLWLDALRMTIVPLVFSLVVTGIASAVSNASAGGVTRRALLLFVSLLFVSAIVGLALGSALLGAWSPSAAALDSVRSGLGNAPVPPVPPLSEWLRGLMPTNVVSSAAEGSIVPLTLFALVFGVALARLDDPRSGQVLGFFTTVANAMLLIVRWVLLLAPIGVFALAFAVAAKVGLGAGALLAHYVFVQVVVTIVLGLSAYALVIFARRVSLGQFARAALPPQAVAASTQSSLAALPPMLATAERLSLSGQRSAVVLPLAVALFRLAAPASIVIVTLTLAKVAGIELRFDQIAIAVLLATLSTLVIAGLPNQITFFAAYAPPALAVGVPIELLPLLLAVDTIPDIFYTITNVTADLAVNSVVSEEAASPEPGAAQATQRGAAIR